MRTGVSRLGRGCGRHARVERDASDTISKKRISAA